MLRTSVSLSPFFVTQPLDENVHAATIEITPDTLNIAATYPWVYGYVELADSLDVNDIDLGTVTINPLNVDASSVINGVATADTSYIVIGDHDSDMTADAEMRFPGENVVSMLAGASASEGFMIRGFMNDGFTYFRGDTSIVVLDDPTGIPEAGFQFSLRQNFPNPFNPTTTIAYSIASSEDVRLSIYDVRGALVRTLVEKRQDAGDYLAQWDGRDARSNRVASGVYFCTLTAGRFTATKKLVLLK